MRRLFLIFILFSYTLVSCQTTFQKSEWSKNGTETNQSVRLTMYEDLTSNVLKMGMSKSDVLDLLGSEQISVWGDLNQGIEVPEQISLSIRKYQGNRIKLQETMSKYNDWYLNNCVQCGEQLIYYLGWESVDPIFLYLEFSKDSKLIRYHKRQS